MKKARARKRYVHQKSTMSPARTLKQSRRPKKAGFAPDDPPFLSTDESTGLVTTNFCVDEVNRLLTCAYCQGILRDPYTLSGCLHTFCKSCLMFAVNSANANHCYKCHEYIGADVSRFAHPDRTLKVLIDKIIFSEIHQLDLEQERRFYQQQGIELKPTAEQDGDAITEVSLEKKRSRPTTIHLLPHENEESLPSLENPYIQTEDSITVGHMKIFLQKRLTLADANLEVYCRKYLLNNELSASFLERAVWTDSRRPLELTYARRHTPTDATPS